MKGGDNVKNLIFPSVGFVCAMVNAYFGGINDFMITLFILMICDYVSGLLVAGVFHNSTKSSTGRLNSFAGFRGIVKKLFMIILIGVAHSLDMALSIDYLRDAFIICFTLNELLSLIENVGLMGIPLPKAITKIIDVLEDKQNEKRN